jgi:diacylglycerol kinase (ATP)
VGLHRKLRPRSKVSNDELVEAASYDSVVRVKSRLIANPVSGTDSAASQLSLINERLREHVGAMDIVITVDRGDAERAAAAALRDGYDHLFVAGGDGTLNEVVNGVGGIPGGFDAVTFGIIPLGTGNDFATALGIPSDIEGALTALTASDRIALDVGRVNDRYFINVSAGGFIAEVSDATDSRLKTIAGKLAYLIGGAQTLFTHEPVRASVRTSSGRDASVTLTVFAVCNSRLIGGGRLIAPDACIDDGLFDVCLIEEMPTLEFLALLKRVSNGEHVGDARVAYFRTPDIELTFARPTKVNTDGEVLELTSCRYHLLPAALRFIAPSPGPRAHLKGTSGVLRYAAPNGRDGISPTPG